MVSFLGMCYRYKLTYCHELSGLTIKTHRLCEKASVVFLHASGVSQCLIVDECHQHCATSFGSCVEVAAAVTSSPPTLHKENCTGRWYQ